MVSWRGAGVAAAAGLVVGAALGVAAGLQWAPELQARWRRAQHAALSRAARLRDPARWRRDSAERAAFETRLRTLRSREGPARLPPREVRRVQALSACAVSFAVRDSAWRALPLFDARAWDWREPGVEVSHGWAYKEGGFGPGDTVTVVLPEADCADIVVEGVGAAAVPPAPPPPPPRVRIRLEGGGG